MTGIVSMVTRNIRLRRAGCGGNPIAPGTVEISLGAVGGLLALGRGTDESNTPGAELVDSRGLGLITGRKPPGVAEG